MTTAFWDSSAIIPLCVQRQTSATVRKWARQHAMVVWWATSVEMRSALERLLRMGELSLVEHAGAGRRMERLRRSWREMQPGDTVREEAESLLSRFPLRAADALQLAAALRWTVGKPRNHHFISGDAQLLDAAHQLGFHVLGA